MFCPTCGQQQAAENVRFCSRCGFLLSGVSEVITNNGLIPNQTVQTERGDSPRWRGVKQGIMIWLVGFFLVALLIALIRYPNDFARSLFAVIALISFFGGFLRMAYALMFQSKNPKIKTSEPQFLQGNMPNKAVLPSAQSIPINDFVAPNWRETDDFVQPYSVVETTTKLLEKEQR